MARFSFISLFMSFVNALLFLHIFGLLSPVLSSPCEPERPAPAGSLESTPGNYTFAPASNVSAPADSLESTPGNTTFAPASNVSAPAGSLESTPGNFTFAPASNVSAPANTSTLPAAVQLGEFWAGATIGTVLRMEAVPGRVFYDFDNTIVKDPIQTLADAGVNAFRVEGGAGQCLGPTVFNNTAATLGDELTFTLDWGCIDIQVKTAQQATALGMRFVLTINQGQTIPAAWESYNYTQFVAAVQTEAQRQLQPFLDAKLVPDIILLENEGSGGFLMKESTTGHIRCGNDSKVSASTTQQEHCGQIPSGNMASYPQLAGLYKAEIAACTAAITAAGLSPSTVRYGLHSHGQYVQWKEGLVHGPNPISEVSLTTASGPCDFASVIPAPLLTQNASELLTILGFSAYLDPMTPSDPSSAASQEAALSRLNATLTQLQGYAEAYGKHTDGPFAGQYRLQALGVEYGTSFTASQIPLQQAQTTMMWDLVKGFSAFLGMLWYEPWYCYADWEGGMASLAHYVEIAGGTGEAPTDTLRTWGAAAAK